MIVDQKAGAGTLSWASGACAGIAKLCSYRDEDDTTEVGSYTYKRRCIKFWLIQRILRIGDKGVISYRLPALYRGTISERQSIYM